MISRLSQSPWSEVKREMTEEKGLDEAVADKIGEYVKHKGSRDLLDRLRADETLIANKSAKLGLDEMAILFDYLDAYGITNKVCSLLASMCGVAEQH